MDQLTATHIAAWLACAAFVIILVNGGFKLARNIKGEDPQPPNSNLGLSVNELSRRVTALEQWQISLIKKLDRDKTEIMDAGEDRARRLHQRIDEMPAQLITILKNTGAI